MMKLKLTEKKIEEVEDGDEKLSDYSFDAAELEKRVDELSEKMHQLATPLQEKVPEQVAKKFFSKYGTAREALKIDKYVDEQGLVRIADIFIAAKIYNNIDLSWHLNRYK